MTKSADELARPSAYTPDPFEQNWRRLAAAVVLRALHEASTCATIEAFDAATWICSIDFCAFTDQELDAGTVLLTSGTLARAGARLKDWRYA